jgi:predicted N-acetyltransferase YhbS
MKIRLETTADTAVVEALVAEAFGPERFAKTVYVFRDGVPPVDSLSLVADGGEGVVGSLRFWPVEIAGTTPALLLGPLVTAPAAQGEGVGAALMREGLARAASASPGRLPVGWICPAGSRPSGFWPANSWQVRCPV